MTTMPTKTPVYRTEAEIEALARRFEQGTLPPAEFNHHAHMTVALWYLARHPYAQAVDRMRASITHFAAQHHQSQLYNETITLFWMKLLRHVLDQAAPDAPLADKVYAILARWGSMGFVFKHYSQDVAFSPEAKARWVEPDLIPLGFA